MKYRVFEKYNDRLFHVHLPDLVFNSEEDALLEIERLKNLDKTIYSDCRRREFICKDVQ